MCVGALRCERLCVRAQHCRLGMERRRLLLARYLQQRLQRRKELHDKN